jgi:hypothetical protein
MFLRGFEPATWLNQVTLQNQTKAFLLGKSKFNSGFGSFAQDAQGGFSWILVVSRGMTVQNGDFQCSGI